MVFQIGITLVLTIERLSRCIGQQKFSRGPLLTSLTSFPSQTSPFDKVLYIMTALFHEIGKLGIKGMFEPSVLVLFS